MHGQLSLSNLPFLLRSVLNLLPCMPQLTYQSAEIVTTVTTQIGVKENGEHEIPLESLN